MDMNRILIAVGYAAHAHSQLPLKPENAFSKYTGEPYIVHPIEVAQIVSTVTDDEDMIVAALLHDVVEDTTITLENIHWSFGENVARMVEGLTDVSRPEDGNRATRKRIDREHTAAQATDVKTIKLADLISNTATITKYDKDFAQVYMAEKELLLPYLCDGHPDLYDSAQRLVEWWNVYKKLVINNW